MPVKVKGEKNIKIKRIDVLCIEWTSFAFAILFRPQATEWVVTVQIRYIIINVLVHC